MYISMKKSVLFIFTLPLLATGFLYPQNNAAPGTSLTGFDGLAWGVEYKEAKDRFRVLASSEETTEAVSIIADIPDTEIKIERKSLVYRYLFYKKPAILLEKETEKKTEAAPLDPATPNQPPVDTNGQADKNAAQALPRLFLVESTFSYVPAEELYNKIAEKYGKRNAGKLDDKTNRGYYVWNLDRGYIIQWIDPYKKMPFTRSIYYVSKEIVEEIRADFPRYQMTKELKILNDILY